MTDRSPPNSHERSIAALSLMLRAQLAVLGIDVLSVLGRALLEVFSSDPAGPLIRTALSGVYLLVLIPHGITVWGLVRFVTSLEDADVRRWGYAAAVLTGLAIAGNLGMKALQLAEVDSRTLSPVIRMAPAVLWKVGPAALLMMLWKFGQVLQVRPPRGLLLSAASALGLTLVGSFALDPWIGFDVYSSNFTLGSLLSDLRNGLFLLSQTALVGTVALTITALRSPPDASASDAAWEAAAGGLATYNWGLRGRIAVATLGLAASPFIVSMRSYALHQGFEGLIALAALACSGVMFVGLVRYALRVEEPLARDHAQVALGFILLAGVMLGLNSLHWIGFPPTSRPLLSPAVVGLLSVTAVVFLLASFHQVATTLREPELALAIFKVGRMLGVSVSATVLFQFADSEGDVVRFLSFAASVALLVSLVRFLLLLGQVAKRMRQGTAPAPEPSLFARA